MEQGIQQIFQQWGHDDKELFGAIEALARKQGESTYQQAMIHLFDKDFKPEKASAYWKKAMAPLQKTGSGIHSFRAALLNYLQHETDELSDPRIIEAQNLEQIRRSAITDGLTQLYNQSYLKNRLQQTIDLAENNPGHKFALIFLDLDHFKQFNDRCGHLQGDKVLHQVARILQRQIGRVDLAARYGGEEFAILMPDSDMLSALKLAEQIREEIDLYHFEGQERLDSGNLTVSGGVACYPGGGRSVGGLIEQADRKLYEAKASRNAILPRQDDSRRASRHQYRSLVEICYPGEVDFRSALTADISRSGVALKCETPPHSIGQVLLRFRYPFWPKDHELHGLIRHIHKETERGGCMLGVEFEAPQLEFCSELITAEACHLEMG